MADALTTISKLINSPPGQLAAGGVLAGIVWKLFERVEAVLNENTKLEIAVWLLGVKVGQKVEPWPDTFAKVFDRVFGTKHLSWKCFWRSFLASCAALCLTLLFTSWNRNLNWYVAKNIVLEAHLWLPLVVLIANAIPDYVSLLETRLLLGFISRSPSTLDRIWILTGDLIFTLYIALVCVTYGLSTVLASTSNGLAVGALFNPDILLRAFKPSELILSLRLLNEPGVASLWFYPAFFTSIWLWLYAGSGFILKAARRFDIGFDWFNRKFDIEKKPLQSIGLVAGALVAIVYWAAVFHATQKFCPWISDISRRVPNCRHILFALQSSYPGVVRLLRLGHSLENRPRQQEGGWSMGDRSSERA